VSGGPAPARRAALKRAYRNTRYVVDAPGGAIVIRIGERCPALEAWLAAEGVACWAFVTAWNPQSKILTNKNNDLRNSALCAELCAAGYRWFAGRGVADAGDWPPEESVLVAGLDAQAAVALGARHGQHAVVTGNAGECAVLRWCAGGEADTIPPQGKS
jgi:hypothetical protein